MTLATVNEFGRSQKGNPKIKLDGKWYPVGRNNVDGIQPGSQVEVEYGSFPDSRTGEPVACINKIRPAPSAPKTNGHAAPPAGACEVSPLDDSGMRFVSNIVGSAITSGKIVKPFEVTTWTIAAYRAFKALGTREPGLDDDLGDEDQPRSENPAPPGASW